jgi:hypothetical protein
MCALMFCHGERSPALILEEVTRGSRLSQDAVRHRPQWRERYSETTRLGRDHVVIKGELKLDWQSLVTGIAIVP